MCTDPLYHPAVVPEAPLEHTEAGLVPGGNGWFVLNAREARVVLAAGAREHQTGADWGGYPVDEAALMHGAGVEQETTEADEAYARLREPTSTPYRENWLPD